MDILKDVAGTGQKIMNNWNEFNYQLSSQEKVKDGIIYTFDWTYSSQEGYLTIKINDVSGEIDYSSTFSTGGKSKYPFSKSLPLYNDSSLLPVIKKVLDTNHISYK